MRNLQKVQGVTMVEVLVAVLVLAVGLIPAFQVFSRGAAGTTMNRDELLAHQYAAEMIDYAQAVGFEGFSEEECNRRLPMQCVEGGAEIESRFKRFLTVEPKTPGGGVSDWPIEYKILNAEVEWTSAGVPQYFVMTSLLFQGRKK